MHCRMDFNIFMSKNRKTSYDISTTVPEGKYSQQLLVPRHSISPSGLHAIRNLYTMSCAQKLHIPGLSKSHGS